MKNKNKEKIRGMDENAEDADLESMPLVGEGEPKPNSDRLLPASILMCALVVSGVWIYVTGSKAESAKTGAKAQQRNVQTSDALGEAITPSAGVTLPVRWGDLGKKMAASGVIDEAQFKALYAQAGGLPADARALLDSSDNGDLVITPQNAGIVLNLLWALGLGNKNPILEQGPMQDAKYGGAGRFASTGGWTIAVGDPMEHYSAHRFITLTADEQELVERVTKGIYRPCCGNSTYFPDCNHGMAMLGLMELMASQGATEDQMYHAALTANSYWFSDTYRTIGRYFENKGVRWSAVDPREVLGSAYSSGQGYARVQQLVAPEPATKSSGSCGV